jgi:hypothetical protein
MGDNGDPDWLVRTELAPRPPRSVAPSAPPPSPPEEEVVRPRAPAAIATDPNAGEIVLRREAPIGTVWLAATDEEADAVFLHTSVDVRNPFTGEVFPYEDLTIDRALLRRLPQVGGVTLGPLAGAPESSRLLLLIGGDPRRPFTTNASEEVLVCRVPADSVGSLGRGDAAGLAAAWSAAFCGQGQPLDVPAAVAAELRSLAHAALERGATLWVVLDLTEL